MTSSRLRFIGNATTLLHLGGFTLLTDPNFLHRGDRAYLGRGLFSKRLLEPAMSVAELPELDAVLLSHLHGDHWDRVAQKGLDRSVPVVTTPKAARTLARRGFATEGLRTWEAYELVSGADRLRVTAMPGRHGPRGVDAVLPPVMGSLLELEQPGQAPLRVYISGDTLNVPELRQIAERCGPLDVAILHLGGTKLLRAVLVTMDGRQGTDLAEMLDPGAVVPIHVDDYTVFTSPLEDFVTAMRQRGLAGRLHVVGRGEEAELRRRGPA